MKHEFTDSEITVAADQAVDTASYYRTIPIDYHKDFLDALPDVPHCGDCAVDRAKAGVYEQLLDHPFFEGWSEADASVEDYMIGRLNEAYAAEQDDWEECTFEDIRKGDRVRAVSPNGDLTEFTVQTVDRLLAQGKYDEVAHTTTATTYRIPAPVTHPDPEEHPVIIVSGAYGVVWDKSYAYISDGSGYHIAEPNNDSVLLPKAITKWGAAKVVACDEM